jgi:hypothetical protein
VDDAHNLALATHEEVLLVAVVVDERQNRRRLTREHDDVAFLDDARDELAFGIRAAGPDRNDLAVADSLVLPSCVGDEQAALGDFGFRDFFEDDAIGEGFEAHYDFTFCLTLTTTMRALSARASAMKNVIHG